LKGLERFEKFMSVAEAVGAVGDPRVCWGIPDEGSLTGSPVARACKPACARLFAP